MKLHKVPENFTHIFQSKLFLLGLSSSSNYSVIGNEGSLGRRYTVGPLCVEYYTGDKEPELSTWRGFRFVIWNPVSRLDNPISWFRISKESDHTVAAFLDIQNTDNYHKMWSDTFKTYYNRIPRNLQYQVVESSLEEYIKEYRAYAKKDISIERNIAQAIKLTQVDSNSTHFYCLENKENHSIVGGIAIVDCVSVNQSYYLSAFTRKDIAPKETGLWLCNYWMNESSKRGISFANLGIVWTKGQPESWKGFSEFKMKFNPLLLVLPRELIRFTFSL